MSKYIDEWKGNSIRSLLHPPLQIDYSDALKPCNIYSKVTIRSQNISYNGPVLQQMSTPKIMSSNMCVYIILCVHFVTYYVPSITKHTLDIYRQYHVSVHKPIGFKYPSFNNSCPLMMKSLLVVCLVQQRILEYYDTNLA